MEQTRKLVALVTGASSGIGVEIARGIACKGIKTILTARNAEKGERVTKLIKEQEGIDNLLFHELDVTSTQSLDDLATWIRSTFGRLDILVNNAGIAGMLMSDDPVATIDTNYRGAKRTTEAMVPLMKHGNTRIINISSVASRLDLLIEKQWKEKLLDVRNLDEQVVEKFVEDFLTNKRNRGGQWTLQKPSVEVYSISKMALSAYTRVSAKQLGPLGIVVCCMCPGFTNTGMTNRGHSAAVGADTAVWLATSPSVSSGQFYVNRQAVSFVEVPFFVDDGKMIPTAAEYLEVLRKIYG